MRVLLISANTERIPTVPLPLGLACVAEACRAAGHDPRLLDLMFEDDASAAVTRSLADFRPDVIGISIRNIDNQNMANPRFLLPAARDIVTLCRTRTAAPIILGGAGYSIFPESALEYLGADFGIRGEGEVVFPMLLERLARGASVSDVPALYQRGRRPDKRQFMNALDDLPLPEPESWIPRNGGGISVPVQGKRGCPMGCSFCTTGTLEGRSVRSRSAQRVGAWLEQLASRGYRDLAFVDNIFNIPPAYAKDICRAIIDRQLDLRLWCIVYPKWVDAELVDLMARAGCREISLGFEAGSDYVLRGFHKRFTSDEVLHVSRMFKVAGIARRGFLLLGGPDETEQSVQESFDLADSLQLDSLSLTVGIRIYPETDLAATAAAEGVISRDADLLHPTFYLQPRLRDWLPKQVAEYAATRPWAT